MTVPLLRCSIDAASPDASSTALLVLGPSLGTTTSVWSGVVQALRASDPAVRILRFDLPGHGASPIPEAALTIHDVAEAALRLVDESGGGRFHYVGLSLGGTVGIELALTHPERVMSLGIVSSNARIATPETWAERATAVRQSGTPSLVGGTPARWFAPDFIAREPELASRVLIELSERVDDESYARCVEALARFDRTADVGDIRARTAVVSASHDPVTTTADLAALAAAIPGAVQVDVPDASHLVPLERPAAVAGVIHDLLAEGSADAGGPRAVDQDQDQDALARGMRVRRDVLGTDHVDRATASITPETAAFQAFLTRYAWGEIWARPDLSRRERSIATLASLVTGEHENEIRMHVRAAITNGLTPLEITEVIMHTALYAGLPPANNAMAIARDVFSETAEGEHP